MAKIKDRLILGTIAGLGEIFIVYLTTPGYKINSAI